MNRSSQSMVIKPRDENTYSCMKDFIPGSYTCTYNDFKKVYFDWESHMKDTVITVPSFIPSIFHRMYLKHQLDTNNILLLNRFPKYSCVWDNLLEDENCYLEKI